MAVAFPSMAVAFPSMAVTFPSMAPNCVIAVADDLSSTPTMGGGHLYAQLTAHSPSCREAIAKQRRLPLPCL